MRYFTYLLTTLLTFVIGLTAAATWSVMRPSPSSPSAEAISIAISPIEFFGWWREKQSGARSHQENEPLPSYAYRQLERWSAADESRSEQINIVYHLENSGSQSVDLMVLAIGDFNISPDGQIAGSNELLRNPTLLTERQNIGQQVVRGLAPGERREVKFTNFNLRAMVDKYLRKEYGPLKPWELRVNIDVRTLDGRPVAQQQGRLRLTLGK
ncbi:MAG TPA: hypothetical protein VM911_15140 [Pyrinomonadaceae bacterium]|jgi:hypothetical protein|nr:hypothetical protein [Pyrinomonadaceae bacterium]